MIQRIKCWFGIHDPRLTGYEAVSGKGRVPVYVTRCRGCAKKWLFWSDGHMKKWDIGYEAMLRKGDVFTYNPKLVEADNMLDALMYPDRK